MIRIRSVVLVAALLASGSASAATFSVNSTIDIVDANPGDGLCVSPVMNVCSLRAAIMEANALPGADTIFVPPGIYTLHLGGGNENAAATGDLDITDALTIVGSSGNWDGDPAATIIQASSDPGGGVDKVFSINPNWSTGFSTTLAALTIRHGKNTSARTGDGYGGGLDFEASGSGSLTIYNCVITDNTTQFGDGGGISLFNWTGGAAAQVTIEKSVISNNITFDGHGGGIHVGAQVPLKLIDTRVVGNSARSSTGVRRDGGGIWFDGPALAGQPPQISGSTISSNRAEASTAEGGGLWSKVALVVRDTTINGNYASVHGGGLYSQLPSSAVQTLTNVTVSGNQTQLGDGAGLFFAGSPAQTILTHATITSNNASNGRGGGLRVANSQTGTPMTVEFRNTIAAGNQAFAEADIAGSISGVSSGNLIGTGGAGGLFDGVNQNQVGVANAVLGPLANNGGKVPTHAVLPGSPALDRGNNALAAGLAFDARGPGFPRLADSADPDTVATVDVGAFEAHPSIEGLLDRTLPASSTGSWSFRVGDASFGLAVTATSSNPSVLADSALSIGGGATDPTRTVTATPIGAGTTTITLTVTGGGATAAGSFVLTVTPPPDLAISKTHAGDFAQAQTGARYELQISNVGAVQTTGVVTVTEVPPSALTVTSMSGTGWNCTLASLSCTRSDPLAGGTTYPPIIVLVDVANDAPGTMTNQANVSGGGDESPGNNVASDSTTVRPEVDLTIAKSHVGPLRQGQVGAIYTLLVENVGAGASSGPITVVDVLPPELTLTMIAGSGWSCDRASATCTRSDVLLPGASFPVITVTVDVAGDAPTTLTNVATVSTTIEVDISNNSASDVTQIEPVADLTVTKAHQGDFTQGQSGAEYVLTVTNLGAGPTLGAVTVTDLLPHGLVATAIIGTGWTCDLATTSCTRSDVLGAGEGYEPVVVIVDVAADAPTRVTNSAVVSGGGELETGNNEASDETTVLVLVPMVDAGTPDPDGGMEEADAGMEELDAGSEPTDAGAEVTDGGVVPAPTEESGTGCGCRAGDANASMFALLLVLGGMASSRKRRAR